MRQLVRWLCATALGAAVPLALAAQGTGGGVRGRVTDAASGAPVVGAQVTVEGATVGAVTGEDGAYAIVQAPAGARTLVARRIGFAQARQPVTVVAGQTATADFVLRAAAVALDQVVVTGTAAPTSRRALGTSVASVDSGALRNTQAVSLDQALQGKVAGAQIVQNSGNPGGGGISVRLRGTSSFISGSDPLYVVDGVIVDNSSAQIRDLGARSNTQNRIADINPNDIERIEVIRGAAAAALYGSRANNGVVQIFTRRGQAGRPKIALLSRVSDNRLRKELPVNSYGFNAVGDSVQRFNYQDQLFRTANVFENNLNVSGGTEQTQYFLGGSWTAEEGILERTDASRKTGRLNLTQQIFPSLRVEAGANFINNRADLLPNGEANGILTAFIFNPTTTNFFPVNGVYPTGTIVNPLLAIERFRYPQETNRFLGNLRARWTPLSNLNVDYTFGYDGYSQEASEFYPRGAFPTGQQATGLSASAVRDSRLLDQNAVATLTTRPRSGIELGSSLGYNYTQQEIEQTTASAFNLIPIGELVSAGATPGAAQNRTRLTTLGFYGQQTASFGNRLFLTGALRADASSTFGADERWQLFPKASVSYVVSDESWYRNSGIANTLSSVRLRSALGYAGNQPSTLNAYSRNDEYTNFIAGTLGANFDGKPGLYNSTTLGNPQLKPERQREVEFGADLGAFGDRLSLEATYYDKLVDGLLLFRPVAPSTGYTRQFADIGAMSNKGLELLARTVNVDNDRVRWETTFTYTRNRNRVQELTIPAFTSASGYPNRIEEGQPAGIFFGAYSARNCETGALLLDSLGRPRPSNTLPAATAAREALSGGSCNNAVSRKLGDPNPDWLGSVLNEFRIGRNASVRLLFDGSFGGDVMNLTRRIQRLGTVLNGAEAEAELLPYGDPRKLAPGYLARTFTIFGDYVEDGTFVKLRELAFSYTVNVPGLRRALPQGVDLSLAGRNLLVWTDYTGYDPEVNFFGQNPASTTGTAADRGFDFASYPIPRTWTLSARFTY
jgi:TonB-dependent SusC/RagA subfamily outer membrane receptor